MANVDPVKLLANVIGGIEASCGENSSGGVAVSFSRTVGRILGPTVENAVVCRGVGSNCVRPALTNIDAAESCKI